MAAIEIIDKLNSLIANEDVFSHEKDVMYFMIQMRKLMERDGILGEHRSVKFYCDWMVHPQKEYNHGDIAEIYEQIYRECVDFYNEIDNGDSSDGILSLLQFKNLKRDLAPLLERYNLNRSRLDSRWTLLTKKFAGILKDQPIIQPSDDISEIVITKAEDNEFHIRISFTEAIIDKRGYKRDNLKYGLGYMN